LIEIVHLYKNKTFPFDDVPPALPNTFTAISPLSVLMTNASLPVSIYQGIAPVDEALNHEPVF
jgi:hypothetical protein